jgi:hypothetical protein
MLLAFWPPTQFSLDLTYLTYFNLETMKLSFQYRLNTDHEEATYVNSVTSTLAQQLTNNGPNENTCYKIAINFVMDNSDFHIYAPLCR